MLWEISISFRIFNHSLAYKRIWYCLRPEEADKIHQPLLVLNYKKDQIIFTSGWSSISNVEKIFCWILRARLKISFPVAAP